MTEKEMGISRLNEELLVEILVRLHVELLLRIKLVCKSWYNLIKSPKFVKVHQQRMSSRSNYILITSRDTSCQKRIFSVSLHSYESLDLIRRIEFPDYNWSVIGFWGTCNGLICMSDLRDYTLLWNPAIEGYKKLPLRPSWFPKRFEGCYVAFGFGFDAVTNHCKFVGFSRCAYMDGGSDESCESSDSESCEYDSVTSPLYDERVTNAEIYNLNTNSWITIELAHYTYIDTDYVSVNGALHWLVNSRNDSVWSTILSFNMSTEKLGYIYLPDDIRFNVSLIRNYEKLVLMVFNGSLALLRCRYPDNKADFADLWVMHEYGVAKSWMKQVTIGPVAGIDSFFIFHRPLIFWKNESILLEGSDKLVSCSLNSSEITDQKIRGIDKVIYDLVVYHMTLVPASGIGSIEQAENSNTKKNKKNKSQVEN